MTKQKPLEEEQRVSMLVIENWLHDGHSRESPLTNNIKHEAPISGHVTVGNRKTQAC